LVKEPDPAHRSPWWWRKGHLTLDSDPPLRDTVEGHADLVQRIFQIRIRTIHRSVVRTGRLRCRNTGSEFRAAARANARKNVPRSAQRAADLCTNVQ
jgi:hypothetical protein